MMLILSKQPNDKISLYTFTTITVSFNTYKRVGLCPTRNKNNDLISTLFRKKTSGIHKRKRPHCWDNAIYIVGIETQIH